MTQFIVYHWFQKLVGTWNMRTRWKLPFTTAFWNCWEYLKSKIRFAAYRLPFVPFTIFTIYHFTFHHFCHLPFLPFTLFTSYSVYHYHCTIYHFYRLPYKLKHKLWIHRSIDQSIVYCWYFSRLSSDTTVYSIHFNSIPSEHEYYRDKSKTQYNIMISHPYFPRSSVASVAPHAA